MKLLISPRPNWPSFHASRNVPKSIESGIESPVTRSERSCSASRTMLTIGYSAMTLNTPRIA